MDPTATGEPVEERSDVAQMIAGLLASASLVMSALGVAYRPVRLLPAAVVLALVAVVMGGRHRGLAAFAIGAAIVCWLAGMTIALITERPLY